ncbi:MAG: hydroxyacid dehydrogenase [Terriglobales bacterium]
MKVVVPEKISAPGLKVFTDAGFEVVQLLPASAANGELARALADADALVVRSAVQVTPDLIAAAPRLRVIGRAGVGVDNVNVAAASARKIVVMNTPGGSSVAVAELALGLMLALARHIPRADATMHAGKWEKKALEGTELMGKTLGLVGCGRIALAVGQRAAAFGMRLLAYDPAQPMQAARQSGIELVDWPQLLARSDYLSLHLSLTGSSRNLLNDAAFAAMKPGVRVVNCARGEVIDEDALLRALASGQVAGAALDVYRKEPPPPDAPLLHDERILAMPHIGASTREAQERVGIAIAEQIRDFLLAGKLANAVNA